jgi:hypothetical protein
VANFLKSKESQHDSSSGLPNNQAINFDRSLPPTPAAIPDRNPDDSGTNPRDGKNDKDRILAQSKKRTPLEKARANMRGDTVVDDPTTAAPVHLENGKPNTDPNLAMKLDPANFNHQGPALNPPSNPQPSSLYVNPNSAKPTNILLQQFPPPVEDGLITGIMSRLRQLEFGFMGTMALIWFFFAFGSGKLAFFLRTVMLTGVTFGAITALHLVERQILRNISEVRMQMERQRGEAHSPPTPESVEWLNSILATVWPLIPPETFISLTDMIEDVMQASLPKFITAVRIADLAQGRNPLRIVAMRGLPDQQERRLKNGEDWIDQGKDVRDLILAIEALDSCYYVRPTNMQKKMCTSKTRRTKRVIL